MTISASALEEILQIPADVLVSEGMVRIHKLFSGHQPGQPYFLPREVFSRFYREEMPDTSCWDPKHWDKGSLWRAIASHEACRVFQDGWEYCPSRLSMDANNGVYAPAGVMQWEYCTTSGTRLWALDYRLFEPEQPVVVGKQDIFEGFHPLIEWKVYSYGERFSIPGDDGFYVVMIPAQRDIPGRTAWTQIRLAASGLPYRCWAEESSGKDEESIARVELKKLLFPVE